MVERLRARQVRHPEAAYTRKKLRDRFGGEGRLRDASAQENERQGS